MSSAAPVHSARPGLSARPARCYPGPLMKRTGGHLALIFSLCLGACPGETPDDEVEWQLVHRDLPGALLSVWGTG